MVDNITVHEVKRCPVHRSGLRCSSCNADLWMMPPPFDDTPEDALGRHILRQHPDTPQGQALLAKIRDEMQSH